MEKSTVKRDVEVIIIGGSAGSLEPILQIIEKLETSNFAIILILHRKVSYVSALADILTARSRYKAKEAEEKEPIVRGSIYVAPADYHLLIEKDHSFSLDASEKVNFSRPSIDVSFESAAEVYRDHLLGILLSGGNADGVEGMKRIKNAGGLCIVQNPASASVSVMPAQALMEMEVDHVLNPEDIATFINQL